MNLSPDLQSVEMDCDGNIVSDISKSFRASALTSPVITSMIPKEKCFLDRNYANSNSYYAEICNSYLSYECFLQKLCSVKSCRSIMLEEDGQNIDWPSEEQRWYSLGENKYTRPDVNDFLCNWECEGTV